MVSTPRRRAKGNQVPIPEPRCGTVSTGLVSKPSLPAAGRLTFNTKLTAFYEIFKGKERKIQPIKMLPSGQNEYCSFIDYPRHG